MVTQGAYPTRVTDHTSHDGPSVTHISSDRLLPCRTWSTEAVGVPLDGFHLHDDELARLGRSDRKGAPDTFDVDGYVALLVVTEGNYLLLDEPGWREVRSRLTGCWFLAGDDDPTRRTHAWSPAPGRRLTWSSTRLLG